MMSGILCGDIANVNGEVRTGSGSDRASVLINQNPVATARGSDLVALDPQSTNSISTACGMMPRA